MPIDQKTHLDSEGMREALRKKLDARITGAGEPPGTVAFGRAPRIQWP